MYSSSLLGAGCHVCKASSISQSSRKPLQPQIVQERAKLRFLQAKPRRRDFRNFAEPEGSQKPDEPETPEGTGKQKREGKRKRNASQKALPSSLKSISLFTALLKPAVDGTAAVVFGLAVGISPFSYWHWNSGDVLFGLELALPIFLFDALVMLPNYANNQRISHPATPALPPSPAAPPASPEVAALTDQLAPKLAAKLRERLANSGELPSDNRKLAVELLPEIRELVTSELASSAELAGASAGGGEGRSPVGGGDAQTTAEQASPPPFPVADDAARLQQLTGRIKTLLDEVVEIDQNTLPERAAELNGKLQALKSEAEELKSRVVEEWVLQQSRAPQVWTPADSRPLLQASLNRLQKKLALFPVLPFGTLMAVAPLRILARQMLAETTFVAGLGAWLAARAVEAGVEDFVLIGDFTLQASSRLLALAVMLGIVLGAQAQRERERRRPSDMRPQLEQALQRMQGRGSAKSGAGAKSGAAEGSEADVKARAVFQANMAQRMEKMTQRMQASDAVMQTLESGKKAAEVIAYGSAFVFTGNLAAPVAAHVLAEWLLAGYSIVVRRRVDEQLRGRRVVVIDARSEAGKNKL